jgi:predicted  nucleic acid-binding Zn-ribbon protein
MTSREHECIECGALFSVDFVEDESDDQVKFCVSCGSNLEVELDLRLYDDEEFL